MAKNKTAEPEKDNLLLRHEKFIETYLECLNGTQAWMIAYDETNTSLAASNSSRLLRNAKIKAELERRFKEDTMGKNEVLKRLRSIANATLYPFILIDEEGHAFINMKDSEAKKHLYLVKKFKGRKTEHIKDKEMTTEHWVEIELHDAMKALELIGKYHALFTEKVVQTEKKIIRVTINREDNA